MSLENGHRLVLRDWAESPEDAIAHQLHLEPQKPPQKLRQNDVLVRVRSCAVGWVDLLMACGQYQHALSPPYIPGLEFAGEVAAVGTAVRTVQPGDAVLADALRAGPRSSGEHTDGGFATYAIIPEAATIRLPRQLSFDQAVNLLGNFETAYHALVDRARLKAGESILINGATGSTGLAAVQLAKHIGASVIATGRSTAKLAEVKALGADHVLQVSQRDGVRAFKGEVKELTGGRGVDVVWDGVGGPITVESMRSMRFGGRYCIIGWAATPFIAKGKGQGGSVKPNQMPTNLIQMKGLDVLGCPAVIATKFDPSLREKRLFWLMERVGTGEISPHVGAVFSMEEWPRALEEKWTSRHVGGCVLNP